MKTGYQARHQEQFPLSFRPTRYDLSNEVDRNEYCEVAGNGMQNRLLYSIRESNSSSHSLPTGFGVLLGHFVPYDESSVSH